MVIEAKEHRVRARDENYEDSKTMSLLSQSDYMDGEEDLRVSAGQVVNSKSRKIEGPG